MANERLARTLTAVDPDQIKLDRIIKEILANKSILARIIKTVVEECTNMSYEQIETYIEGEVFVACVPMEPGVTNTIGGSATEDFKLGEGCVYYDIRTYLRIPMDDAKQIKILLNVEAQKDDTPGYDVTERAIYYGCRMISSQLDVEFTNHTGDPIKYGNIKKVYSIWLCTESAEKRANAIVRYKLEQQTVFAQNVITANCHQRYDLMQVVLIYISKNYSGHNCENDLIRMMSDLFNDDIEASKKIELLENRHHLSMSEPMKREVADMCEYTAAIAEKNRQKGREEGWAEGRAEEKLDAIQRLLKKGFDREMVISLGYSMEEYEKAEQRLSVKK